MGAWLLPCGVRGCCLAGCVSVALCPQVPTTASSTAGLWAAGFCALGVLQERELSQCLPCLHSGSQCTQPSQIAGCLRKGTLGIAFFFESRNTNHTYARTVCHTFQELLALPGVQGLVQGLVVGTALHTSS